MTGTPDPKPSLFDRVQAFRARHAKAEIAVFFAAGFLFDIVTLSRIDDVLTLVQQAAYLLVLAGLLLLEQRHALGLFQPKGALGKAWKLHEDVVHFLFGSLLSSYTLFYFKAASGFAALGFMVLLAGLLVANELPRFRAMGPLIRIALFGLSVTSYFSYLLPMAVGMVRWWLFTAAVLLSALTAYGMFRLVRKWSVRAETQGIQPGATTTLSGAAPGKRAQRMLIPSLAVNAALLALYFAHAIPPVPLSLSFIGIYHGVKKVPGGYELSHQRPQWKLWQTGDQTFRYRPGDKVYVFARIFAPSRFRDRVFVRWAKKRGFMNWQQTDAIPMSIASSGAKGWGGYAYKANYEPGEWRVEIETEDGRDIGLIHFTLEPDDGTDERVFAIDRG